MFSKNPVINSSPTIGVLLSNLGTPDAPTAQAVRRYLAEFLTDRRVVEIPAWLWKPLLYGYILNTRPFSSAKTYQTIWTAEGSPLLANSLRQQQALQQLLAEKLNQPIQVVLGMRYGKPSLNTALAALQQANVHKILLLPLYPQYASATTGSTFAAVTQIVGNWRWVPELRTINHYADNEGYIAALAASIKAHWQQAEPGQKLLFSFHGLPERSIALGDPYYALCQQTAALTAEKLQIPNDSWQVVFQSRFGRAAWLQPYCETTLIELAQQGCKRIDIICPGFAADCLETLEEISIRYRESFVHAGGNTLHYIPALNDNSHYMDALANLVLKNLQGWIE